MRLSESYRPFATLPASRYPVAACPISFMLHLRSCRLFDSGLGAWRLFLFPSCSSPQKVLIYPKKRFP